MHALITVMPGDGVGPEVVAEGRKILHAVATKFSHRFDLCEALVGGAAIDITGDPLPPESLKLCKEGHAVLLGAVGGPKWDDPDAKVRPEQGLLKLRRGLELFANLRPVQVHPLLIDASPLKPALLQGLDLMVVRELTGGIYFGAKERQGDTATDVCTYSVAEVQRVVRVAARLAQKRRGKLTSVDKANVLETSRLWRSTTTQLMQAEFPQVQLEHMLVDSAAMHLLRRPRDFDVIVTENMFGDILTDEASMLAGSMGLLPSASLGAGTLGLYEPIHGSAPDIAGQGVANPYATILSVAMLLRHSLGLHDEAGCVERAVAAAIEAGVRTQDLGGSAKTAAVGDAVIAHL